MVIIEIPLHKSHYKFYEYIIKYNYVLGGMLFTICKAQIIL